VAKIGEETATSSSGFFSRVFRNVADVSTDLAINPLSQVVRRLTGQLDTLTEEHHTFGLAIWFLSSLSAGIVGTLALIRFRKKKRPVIVADKRDKNSAQTPRSKIG
jgi:hypothetical protein